MRDFFSTKIGSQTIAFIITVISFPFLYLGGSQGNSGLLTVGIVLMLSSMLAVPVITFIHGKKSKQKDMTKMPTSKLSGSER